MCFVQKKGTFRIQWFSHFYTLKKGVFKYFLRMGDKYPPEGAEVKATLQLHLFKEATIREEEPMNVELFHEEEPKGKDYEFKVSTEEEAKNFCKQLNIQIAYAKWLQRNPGAAVVDTDGMKNQLDSASQEVAQLLGGDTDDNGTDADGAGLCSVS